MQRHMHHHVPARCSDWHELRRWKGYVNAPTRHRASERVFEDVESTQHDRAWGKHFLTPPHSLSTLLADEQPTLGTYDPFHLLTIIT